MTVYLDNAATSFPKPEPVYREVDRAFREFGANPGRGGHRLTLEVNRMVMTARETLAEFFGTGNPSGIVFTQSATHALNQAVFGILRPGDRVVTSSMEHNALTRPFRALQDRGVTVVKVPADGEGWISPEAVKEACAEKTRMVALTHCSNVTGTLQPIEEIGPWCRREGILFLVDAAQSAGLVNINAGATGIDLLAVPGHKGLFGPPGIGCLAVREGLRLDPLMVGGTGTHSQFDLPPEEMPERLECGTLNTPGIAGLLAGVNFLREEGLERIRERETEHLARLLDGLAGVPGISLFGPRDARLHGGALSFNLEGMDPAECCFLLDQQFGICTRAGLHCAPDAHKTIGTFPRGTVRVSPGYFTRTEDLDALIAAAAALAAHPRR